jgi:hypothetical protein
MALDAVAVDGDEGELGGHEEPGGEDQGQNGQQAERRVDREPPGRERSRLSVARSSATVVMRREILTRGIAGRPGGN